MDVSVRARGGIRTSGVLCRAAPVRRLLAPFVPSLCHQIRPVRPLYGCDGDHRRPPPERRLGRVPRWRRELEHTRAEYPSEFAEAFAEERQQHLIQSAGEAGPGRTRGLPSDRMER